MALVEGTGRARRRASRSATERVDSIQMVAVSELEGRLRLHGGVEHEVEVRGCESRRTTNFDLFHARSTLPVY